MKKLTINDIKPYAKNAKKHPEKQLLALANIVREVGWRQPVLVNLEGTIIAGHGRWFTYQTYKEEWELKEIWVINTKGETVCGEAETTPMLPDQEQAYRFADNKLNESEWDMELAIPELKLLSPELFELTGFDHDLLLDPDEKDDDVPELPKKARSKIGDLYQLGQHYLLCGDSTKEEDVLRLLGDKKADMVFTSPPYSDMREYNGEKDLGVEHLASFIKTFLPFAKYQIVNLGLQRKEGAIYPYWDIYINTAKEAGLKLISWNVWNRSGSGGSVGAITAMFPIEHEWIFVFGEDVDKDSAKKTVKNKHGGQHRTGGDRQADGSLIQKSREINDYRRMGTVQTIDFERDLSVKRSHPATFPAQLAVEYIKSLAQESVIDPFLGSGSTLIACEKTGRICYGMELEPIYIDVVVQRYVDYTGDKEVILNGKKIKWQDLPSESK